MNLTTHQPVPHMTMITALRIKTNALFFAFSAVFALTCAAAENVPYDLSRETYKTETLFSYDGCYNHRLMGNSGQPKVFKDNVYVAIFAQGGHPRILQVPLDGGDAKIGPLTPDVRVATDSHRYFTLSVDKAGYIHVVGGMHGGPWKYWISAKPEDVSSFIQGVPELPSGDVKSALEDASDFVPTFPGQKQAPPGFGITYPHFSTDAAGNIYLQSRGSTPSFQKDRQGKIVHIGLLSTYDADQHAWRLLGADIPKEFGGHPGHPVTVWGDCFENGKTGDGWYVVNTAGYVAAPDNTLHFLFHITTVRSEVEQHQLVTIIVLGVFLLNL